MPADQETTNSASTSDTNNSTTEPNTDPTASFNVIRGGEEEDVLS